MLRWIWFTIIALILGFAGSASAAEIDLMLNMLKINSGEATLYYDTLKKKMKMVIHKTTNDYLTFHELTAGPPRRLLEDNTYRLLEDESYRLLE